MVVEVKNINKVIDGHKILNNVNLKINKGEVLGLVGPNGAGKTTLVRLLLNLYNPTSGSIYIDNVDVTDKKFNDIKKNIGFLLDNIGLFKDLTAWENLEFFDRIYYPKSKDNERETRITNLLKTFNLLEKKDSKITFFSRGMKQRLALARALINDPKLLILDEPSRGLDLEGQFILRDFIKKANQKGCTILINSHDLGELQKVCTNIAFIQNGEIIISEKYEEIEKRFSENTYLIKSTNLSEKISELQNLKGVNCKVKNKGEVLVNITNNEFDIKDWILTNKIKIDEFKVLNKDLESIYSEIYLNKGK